MKRTVRLVCVALWLGALAAQGAAVDLVYEHATSPTGPWRPVAASDQTHRADGSITVESGPIHFYRLRIDQAGANAPSFVRLGSLTPDSASRLNTRIGELSRFLRPLAITRGTDTSDPTSETLADLTVVDAWRGTTFASNTIPIYDPAYRNGLEPAYLEIKVLGSPTPRRNGVDGTDRESGNHRGSILMSLGDQDVGIPYFNTEGETPTERLVAKLGLVDGAGRRILTPPAGHKVLRYGPTFHVLEDPTGEAVASEAVAPRFVSRPVLAKTSSGAFVHFMLDHAALRSSVTVAGLRARVNTTGPEGSAVYDAFVTARYLRSGREYVVRIRVVSRSGGVVERLERLYLHRRFPRG